MTKARKTRSSSGQQLVEVIVAVAMTGILAVMMGTSLAQLMATSTLSENQLKAGEVAQELLDRIRRTPYGLISATTNNYTVQMYSDDGVVPNGVLPFQTTPLLCDVSQYTWSNASLANRFRGPGPNGYATASASLQPYSAAHSATQATITVTWAENQSVRSFVLESVISNGGMHE
jgi:type II secretory pathway pseudopilin PulG